MLIINKKYLNKNKIEKLKQEFLKNKPFNYLSLSNFINYSEAENILKILINQEYYKEENDLYQFNRTLPFKNIPELEIQNIYNNFFNEDFIEYIEKLTKTKLSKTKKELHSLNFSKTDYLLCHDDMVQGRKIAFILNLSKNWLEKYGGNLELFSRDINNNPEKVVKKIVPEFNQFNLFLVSKKSYHQVSEILTNKNRISLAGWFYEE